MDFDFGTGTDRTYNFISIFFLIATALTCIITLLVLLFGGGGNVDTGPALVLPTQNVLPSPTTTLTPTVTRTPLPATFTPTFTATVTPSRTPTLTLTTTVTTTLSPSPTITVTGLPTETPTETATPAPTLGTPPPSPSPFLFDIQGEPVFSSNLNASACAWQGIGGQVLDINGDPYPTQLRVSVIGGGLPTALTALSGTNTLYGAGGYEVQLANSINTQTYFVQLETELGTVVSEQIQVTFPGTCEGNLALVTFQQTRPN